jgi:2-C-methyl-D-erythritol 4-phosphate cytidylyltransferase/2-C-methyl-D-erythritol 4-phosphate cytidylyltransferase/2-C-methyl-D-erythritol 2,4-cyclodiphosphate synthase
MLSVSGTADNHFKGTGLEGDAMTKAQATVWGIVVAAGAGRRMGSQNKAWMIFQGRPVLYWALWHLQLGGVSQGVVVVRGDDVARTHKLLQSQGWHRWTVAVGGQERYQSVRAGLDALPARAEEAVLVHDAARFLVPPAVVRRVVAALPEHPAVVPVIAVIDTVKAIVGDKITRTVPRDQLALAQTPQGFRVDILREAYRQWGHRVPTDDAEVVEALGMPVLAVPGDRLNLKLTTPDDVPYFEWRLGVMIGENRTRD